MAGRRIPAPCVRHLRGRPGEPTTAPIAALFPWAGRAAAIGPHSPPPARRAPPPPPPTPTLPPTNVQPCQPCSYGPQPAPCSPTGASAPVDTAGSPVGSAPSRIASCPGRSPAELPSMSGASPAGGGSTCRMISSCEGSLARMEAGSSCVLPSAAVRVTNTCRGAAPQGGPVGLLTTRQEECARDVEITLYKHKIEGWPAAACSKAGTRAVRQCSSGTAAALAHQGPGGSACESDGRGSAHVRPVKPGQAMRKLCERMAGDRCFPGNGVA